MDFCYADPALEGRCAMFSYTDNVFHYENQARKKNQILTLPVPVSTGRPSIAYLGGLATDKKLKLTTEDILFIERALEQRAERIALRNWNKDQVSCGFIITESGLAYKVLEMGDGPRPENGKKVSVHYAGYFSDGKKFDSSVDRGQEFQFTLGQGQVIKGWDEGVAMMNAGSHYLFRLPPSLAYGERGYPGAIPPNATLFFDVRLIAVP